MPSPTGTRIAPRVDEELRKKLVKASAAQAAKKTKAANKIKEEDADEVDEFDALTTKSTGLLAPLVRYSWMNSKFHPSCL